MYLKLAIRNARRSVIDYLLYIVTMIVLLSIICISNCIALWGNMQADFQTVSLPLLIVLIMVFLISYINHFMVRQRAKEFATYLLLGMKKGKRIFAGCHRLSFHFCYQYTCHLLRACIL